MPASIGLVEVEGVAGIILAADAGCKAADVELLGWGSIGGFTTVFFSGSISDVDAALKSGQWFCCRVGRRRRSRGKSGGRCWG